MHKEMGNEVSRRTRRREGRRGSDWLDQCEKALFRSDDVFSGSGNPSHEVL
jgi:hypothetical protein